MEQFLRDDIIKDKCLILDYQYKYDRELIKLESELKQKRIEINFFPFFLCLIILVSFASLMN